MKNPIKTIWKSTEEALSSKKYFGLFLLISVLIVVVYILIPTFTIKGNDLLFQLSVFTLQDWFLIVPLSLLIGLMVTMQIYSYKKTKKLQAGKGIVGASSGIIAGLFGTAGCSSCLAALFGFLGFGNVLFLLEHQVWITIIATSLILVSLYFTSKKITCGGVCK